MVDLVRQEVVRGAHTVVIKIGTNVLASAGSALDRAHLADLAGQIAEIRRQGRKVILVSSGAIGAGLGRLGRAKRPTTLPELQAVAAIGQSDLMDAYDACFRPHGLHAAQLLLTAEDFNQRERYLNVRNTILKLLEWEAVPVINENDTVSVAEIRFGDNDQLAAMVTNLIRAPLLIILSVVEGLFPAGVDPHGGADPIDTVLTVDDSVLGLAGTSTSGLGTGGMKSKLQAARIASAAGENVWIANGRRPDVLRRLLAGEKLGTLILAKGESVAAWKRWIGYTVKPRGGYVVDEGAKEALVDKGKSLLPIGAVELTGRFEPGDVVSVSTASGEPFARGLTNYSSDEARLILRQPTHRLAELLASPRYDELIHRDNLVIL